MTESIKFAKDLIDVLNYISDKLGATIDWGNAELIPYLKELGNHIIAYKEGIAWMWIIVAAISIVIGIICMCVSVKKDSTYLLGIAVILIIVGLIIIVYNGNTIIACRTFPEKVILEYITDIKNGANSNYSY